MLGPVELVDEIDSTNAELLRRAAAGAAAGAVLVADHQRAGRGRLDRTWEAAPGTSLLVSVLLRPSLPPGQAHLLTMAAGLAAVAACDALGCGGTGLKWPNDVVVDEAGDTKKVAGLLAEAVVGADGVDAVVVGMGLNLLDGPHLPGTASCLERVGGRVVERAAVLEHWLDGYAERLALVDAGDVARVVEEYRSRCATIGRVVRIDTGSGTVDGTALDVEADGRLVVDTGGTLERFAVGDVVHARLLGGASDPSP